MKSQLTVVGIVIIFAVNLLSVSVNTDLANAKVVCVDKYNFTSFIPCSDQNAISKDSIKSSQSTPARTAEGTLAAKNTTTNQNTTGQVTCVVPAPTSSNLQYVPGLCDDPAAAVLLPNGSISGDFGNQTSANTIRNMTSSTQITAAGNMTGNMTSTGNMTNAGKMVNATKTHMTAAGNMTNASNNHGIQQYTFQRFTDTQGRFSVDYPADWLVKAAQSRYEPIAASFYTTTQEEGFVVYTHDVSGSQNFSFTTANIDNYVNLTTEAFQHFLTNFTIYNTDTTINRIDGNAAVTPQQHPQMQQLAFEVAVLPLPTAEQVTSQRPRMDLFVVFVQVTLQKQVICPQRRGT